MSCIIELSGYTVCDIERSVIGHGDELVEAAQYVPLGIERMPCNLVPVLFRPFLEVFYISCLDMGRIHHYEFGEIASRRRGIHVP